MLVARRPDEEQLETWRRGVVLENGYRTALAEVRVDAPFGQGAWLRVVLKEARKRQIRETGRLLGLPVVPKYTPQGSSESTAMALRNTLT